MVESVRSDLIPYAKFLDTLDLGESCDALFYLRSIYWLNIDEVLLLSSLLNMIIIDLCPG